MCIVLNWIYLWNPSIFELKQRAVNLNWEGRNFTVQTLCPAPYRHLVAAYLKYRASDEV